MCIRDSYDILEEKTAKARKIKKSKLAGTRNLSATFDRIDSGQATEEDLAKWVPILRDIFATQLKDKNHSAKDREDYFMERAINDGKQYADLTDMDKQGMLVDAFVEKKYSESLENAYIQTLEDLITHPLNFDNLIKPNSAEDMKDLKKDINKKLQVAEIDYASAGFMLSRKNMSGLRQAFVSGKQAIGVAAVGQTNHAQNQRAVVYVNKDRILRDDISEDDKKWLGNGTIAFPQYNSAMINGQVTAVLSKAKNAVGEYISDIVGMFIDGYVDIAAGPWIMEIGATPIVTGTWLTLVKMGVPIKHVAYFMNQPIIREHLKQLDAQGYSGLFNNAIADELLFEYRTASDKSLTKIPSTKVLGDMIGVSVENMTDHQKIQQRFFLNEFLKYAKMGEHLFRVTQGTNMDTATLNDPFLVFKKQEQLKDARKTIFSAEVAGEDGRKTIPAADGLLDNSFVGRLNDKFLDIRDALTTVLISDRPLVRGLMEKILLPYINLSDREYLKVAQKVVADFFDWAVQTDRGYNKEIAKVLLAEANPNTVAKKIMDLKKEAEVDPEHELHGNMVLEAMMKKSGENKLKPDNLEIEGKFNRVYEQNQLISSFEEIREYLDGNESYPGLYNQLVRLAILQSGLTTSPISFSKLLPYNDFKEIYNKTLSKLESMPNLENYYDLRVFERNNWNNTDIVPYFRPKLVFNKRDNTWDMPAFDYRPKSLQKAYQNGTIPMTAQIPTWSRDAKDFVTVSWESGTAKQKADLKKMNDYSYINKMLMRKVYDSTTGLAHEEVNGDYRNYVYVDVNAWGDSFKAQEFYDYKSETIDGVRQKVVPPSVIDNGYIKVVKSEKTSNEVSDDMIMNVLEFGRADYVEMPASDTIVKKEGKELNLDTVTLDTKTGEVTIDGVKFKYKDGKAEFIEAGYSEDQADSIIERICNL